MIDKNIDKTIKMKGQNGIIYDAVEFKNNNVVSLLKSVKYTYPIVNIQNKVYLTFLTGLNKNEKQFDIKLIKLAQSISNNLMSFFPKKTVNIIFPKIDSPNIIKINHDTIKVMLDCERIFIRYRNEFIRDISKSLKFDRPFIIWFTHGDKVIFAKYLDYADWKDPGIIYFS